MKEVLNGTVTSPFTLAARDIATSLLKECGRPNYSEQYSTFSNTLIEELNFCFVPKRTHKLGEETCGGVLIAAMFN